MTDRLSNPIRAVSVVCRRDGRFLLVRRGRAPAKGLLAFPGGRVETGESDEIAARRELREETSLEAGALRHLRTIRIEPERSEETGPGYALAVFLASEIFGEAQAGDDAAAVHWMTVEEMADQPITESTLAVARDVSNGRI